MKQKILDIFYNEVLPQANGKRMVCVDEFLFVASFCLSSQIENIDNQNIPVIQIHNQDRFNNALIQYTENMISF